jgi:hypothetical protein
VAERMEYQSMLVMLPHDYRLTHFLEGKTRTGIVTCFSESDRPVCPRNHRNCFNSSGACCQHGQVNEYGQSHNVKEHMQRIRADTVMFRQEGVGF